MDNETDLDKSLREGWGDALTAVTDRLKLKRLDRVRSLFRIDDSVDEDAVAIADPDAEWNHPRDGTALRLPAKPVSELSVADDLPQGPVGDLRTRVESLANRAVAAEDRHLAGFLAGTSVPVAFSLGTLRLEASSTLPDDLVGTPVGLLLPTHLWTTATDPADPVIEDDREPLKQALEDELGGPIVECVTGLESPLLVPLQGCTIHEAFDYRLHRPSDTVIALTTRLAVDVPSPNDVLRLPT